MAKTSRMSRKKTFRKKRNKRKAPAGDKLTRTFKYTEAIIPCPGIAGGSGPLYQTSTLTHSMTDAGAADASVFLKYYQFFRLKKIYLKIRTLNTRLEQTIDYNANNQTPAGIMDRCHVHCIPWRDGVMMPALTTLILTKLKQTKGCRTYTLPFTQLRKGVTISYTPNTLDIGYETSGVVTYNNYRPNYGQWIANNDAATKHYGYIIIVEQYGQSPIQLGLSQSVTVDFKYKCNDPLVTLEATTEENSNENIIASGDLIYELDNINGGQVRGVVNTWGALLNEDEDDPTAQDHIKQVESLQTMENN